MDVYEIYNATHRFKNCDDTRPWLIVEIRSDNCYGCLPIAS